MARTGYIKETQEKRFDIIHTAKSLGISYIVSIILLFVFSILATIFTFDSSGVNIGITLITCISVLLCGYMTARGVGRGGLINGVVAGVLYTVLLYLIGCLVINEFSFNLATIIAILLGIVCGGLGGVFAVNTRRHRK
ncbi:MAG: TIGR04086 family membrane protein [Clostridia bacterium]|nr:TIGR04086 family membrane protein [Clostridia bacterium]